MWVSHRHLALVLVLQSKVVSLYQVEVDTNQVKQHFARGTLLVEKKRGGGKKQLRLEQRGNWRTGRVRRGKESDAQGTMSHSSSSGEC